MFAINQEIKKYTKINKKGLKLIYLIVIYLKQRKKADGEF